MAVSTMTTKGQITIPAEVRRALGLRTGSRVTFVPTDAGTYELVAGTGSIRTLKGVIERPEEPVSLAEMERAIAEGASEGAGA